MGKTTYQDDKESGTLVVIAGEMNSWPTISISFNNAESPLGARMARELMIQLEDLLRSGPRAL